MTTHTVPETTDELVPLLLGNAFTREEEGAVHVLVQLDQLLLRPDFRSRYLSAYDVGVVVDWHEMATDLDVSRIPLSPGERVMVALALSLVGARPMCLDDLQLLDKRNVDAALDAITYVATGSLVAVNMPDNARYASRHAYIAEPVNQCSCHHPHDLHYQYGCCNEDCTCSYVPPPMNLVEAVRILNRSDAGWTGWAR